ncbi:hypothetical protein [Massilia eburnea]|uniref:hypothetical protein n=1 Tax=Massilia eburnea TaxID=1776165 RepID=UPI001478F04C|nr:hypothetical protein [Massilia eburnea]
MYRSLLTYADGTAGQTERLQVAAQLATSFGAHLIGTAACGGPEMDMLIMGSAALSILPGLNYEPVREAARIALSDFDAEAARMGIESREQRLAESSLETALVLQSRYCDLVIASETIPPPPPMSSRQATWRVTWHSIAPDPSSSCHATAPPSQSASGSSSHGTVAPRPARPSLRQSLS